MEIDIFQMYGVGFPESQRNVIRQLNLLLNDDFRYEKKYSNDISRLEIDSRIHELKHQISLPKPHFKKARIFKATDYPGWPKDWPDRHMPDSLALQTNVDFDAAAQATGSALRHALVDPICATLLLTPKAIQQRIRIQNLIADLKIWADLDD
jgi:hypothetical protein